MKTKTLPISKRGLNFEMLMWYFTRLTALGMYLFILIGVLGALYLGARTQMTIAELMRWGFMPVVDHVQNSNIQDLANWALPIWKLTGSILVLLAVSHGSHGLVTVADDYITNTQGRKIVRVLSVIFMLAMMVVGMKIVWSL